MIKLRTMFSVPGSEWLLFAEGAMCMGWARLLVGLVPLRHWRAHIEDSTLPAHNIRELTDAERQQAKRVTRAIRRVEHHSPIGLVCLPQALAARWMLKRRGIDTQLYLGTRRAAEEDREFHAWLKAGSWWITGHCNEAEYVTFTHR